MISYLNSMMIQFKIGEIISSVKDLLFAIVVVIYSIVSVSYHFLW